MKSAYLINLDELGKSDYTISSRPGYQRQKLIMAGLILFFILIAFLADLWPLKNIPDGYGYPGLMSLRALAMRLEVSPAMRYSTGAGSVSFRSLPYVAAVKLFYFVLPHRLLCLRAVSVLSTALALFLLYRIAVILFSPLVAIIYLFLLVTSPVYLENFRSFGFIPFSNLVVSLAGYLLAVSLNNKRVVIKYILLTVACYLTFSLYAASRLIIVFITVFLIWYSKKEWQKIILFLVLLFFFAITINTIFGNTKKSIISLTGGITERLPINQYFSRKESGSKIAVEYSRRLHNNLNIAAHYLGFKHRGFYDQNEEIWVIPRLIYNAAYIPFFVVGVIINLWKRKKSNVFLILWFLSLSVPLLFSSGLYVRRIIFSLSPLYLIIALGLVAVFRFISRIFNQAEGRKIFTALSLGFLMLIITPTTKKGI